MEITRRIEPLLIAVEAEIHAPALLAALRSDDHPAGQIQCDIVGVSGQYLHEYVSPTANCSGRLAQLPPLPVCGPPGALLPLVCSLTMFYGL